MKRAASDFRAVCLVALVAAWSGCADAATPRDEDSGVDAARDAPLLFDVPRIDYPDSPPGRVAAALGGCTGIESAGCHGSAMSAGLSFTGDPGADLAQLVGRASTERPELLRVQAFAPDSSWLLLKLRNARDAGVDTAMPLGTDGDPALANDVQTWIDEGATNPFVDADVDGG